MVNRRETATLQGAMMTVKKKVVTKELMDGLLADYRKPEYLIGENGMLKPPAPLS